MQFKRGRLVLSGKPISVWFRQPNAFGVALQDVAAKWIEDTESDFSAQSLVNYINAKMPGCAMTEDEFAAVPDVRKRYRN